MRRVHAPARPARLRAASSAWVEFAPIALSRALPATLFTGKSIARVHRDETSDVTSLRSGTAGDAAQLATLRWESRSDDERAREPAAAFEARFTAWLVDALASSEWRVAVAADGTRLVGCMYLRRVDTVPVPGLERRAWGYVTHAYVIASRRNRGIGHGLLAHLIAEASAMELVELHVWPSQGAISLYTRAGFRSPEVQRAGDAPDEPSYVLPLGGRLG